MIPKFILEIKTIRCNKGSTSLPAVMAIIMVISIIATVLLIYNQKSTFSTKREEQKEKALYVAETGINNYLFNLNKDPDYYQNTRHPAEDNWQNFGQGQYKLTVTPLQDAVGVELTATGRIDVKNNGRTNYQERKIKAVIQKRSFLKYLYFTDHETSEGTGSRIWFITGDVIKGPLHSNDYINISGSPRFKAKVTTARTFYPSVGSAIFEQGYEENVQPLEMPTTNNQLKTWSQNGGYYYNGSTTINLNSNGTIDVQNTNALSTGPRGVAVALPGNGVIYVDGQTSTKYSALSGNIFISGTLKGTLTIASKGDIYIMGNILYSNANDDMLGLISENYIYINHYDNRNRDVAPQNLTINAALFSLNHSFTFEQYARPPRKGTLTILGSLGQRYRGAIGTFSGNRIISGYTKDYNYDQRMQYDEPPHFIEPLNTGFYVSSWEEI